MDCYPPIRSRCLVEALTGPDQATAAEWLRQTTGEISNSALSALTDGMGPLDVRSREASGQLEERAASLAALGQLCAGRVDPVVLAGKMSKLDAVDLLGWLQQFIGQMIRWHAASAASPWGEGW